MDFEQITTDLSDHVLTITLNRPDRLNAWTETMFNELLEAFDRADADDEVRAVIVTGAGRAFCTGADLGRGGTTFAGRPGAAERAEDHRDGGGIVTLRIFDMTKPVIAAINGPAVGFGITLTLAMDVRIASTAAKMGFVFARRGVVPEACSTWFLPRIVGIAQALKWCYTGRVFPAQEALAGRLVSKVVAADELLPTARALAREIADKTAPVSIALIRQMMWRMLGADDPMEAHKIDSREAHRIDSLGMWHTGRSADAHEGVTSFLEKRPPRFSGRPSKDMPPFYPWWT